MEYDERQRFSVGSRHCLLFLCFVTDSAGFFFLMNIAIMNIAVSGLAGMSFKAKGSPGLCGAHLVPAHLALWVRCRASQAQSSSISPEHSSCLVLRFLLLSVCSPVISRIHCFVP